MDKKLYKDSSRKQVAGVCAGFADYFNADVTLIRVAWALVSLMSFGVGVIGYIACSVIMPDKSTLY